MKYFTQKYKPKMQLDASSLNTKELSFKDIFGQEFTGEDFEEIKIYNADKNRQCFMCLRVYKKKFDDLTEADKYHIAVCNLKEAVGNV